jgi:predicted acyltransferase
MERAKPQVNSKMVVTASAVLLLAMALVLMFLPQETAAALGLGNAPMAVLLLQVFSAALLGMGFLNWLSKGNPMGGIYSRPLALQNFLLFGVGAISLDRAAFHTASLLAIQIAAGVFTILALAFGWLIFFHDPTRASQERQPHP